MNDPNSTIIHRGIDKRLTIAAKRTYSIYPNQKAVLAREQVPVVKKPKYDDAGCLVDDMDGVTNKLSTDLVVKGKVHSPEHKEVRELEASVAVLGKVMKRVLCIGDRVCEWNGGHPRFTNPEPFTSMELSYSKAYGGSDETARKELDEFHLEELQKYIKHDLSCVNLCVYSRNFAGKGYVIHENETMDGVSLPNFEDPLERLTPRNLPVRNPKKWYFQPMPAGFGWYDYHCFPRSAFMLLTSELGSWDELPQPDEPPIREIRMGYLPEDFYKEVKPIEESLSVRLMNGASPGLVFPHLNGNEEITLTYMDPEHPEFKFTLPGEVPRVIVKPLSEDTRELKPILFSIIIEKEKNLVSLVWGACTFTKYPYTQDKLDRIRYRVLWE